MKCLKAILFTLIAAVPAMAYAEDIQDPFYLPEANHVLSETGIGFSKNKNDFLDKSVSETKKIQERITYGITDSLFVSASLADSLADETDTDKFEIRYWNAGLIYRLSPMDNSVLDLALYYDELRAENTDRDDTWRASARIELMRDMGIKPYAAVEYTRDAIHFGKGMMDTYNFKAGAWTKIDKLSLMANVNADYTHGLRATYAYAAMEADYALAENIAVGITAKGMFYEHNTIFSSRADYEMVLKTRF